MHTLPLGSILKGTYRVEALIGAGGFAHVYRATHLILHIPLAVKVLNLDDPSHLDPRLNLRERFLQEARLAASLIHPNVCRVHDFGELPDGRPYLVMDFLEGNDLEQELHELEGVLPPERAVKLILQALEGLEGAHARGIVHKDLKPSNLYLVQPATPQERAVITDFGIARVIDGAVYTVAKQVVGTPRYIAPEYADQQRVSPAIDVYQMGLVLAEALTGLPCVPDGPPVVQMKLHIDGRLNFPADGRHYMVMELLEGQSLSDVLKERGRLQAPEAVLVLEQAMAALIAAHAAGVIHRDLKPENLFVTRKPEGWKVTLLDFGLAKQTGKMSQHTSPDLVLGTPGFMAPEQIRGQETTPAIDIYAMGVVAWCMLTGREPYSGGSMVQVMKRHLESPVPQLRTFIPGVPSGLEALVLQMMSKEPKNRPTAEEARKALVRLKHDDRRFVQTAEVTQLAAPESPLTVPEGVKPIPPTYTGRDDSRRPRRRHPCGRDADAVRGCARREPHHAVRPAVGAGAGEHGARDAGGG